MAQILKVNDINVYYGSIHAIKGISFEVNEGEIVTLIGANGAGKSTTLNTISGLLRSKTGSIEFFGESLAKVAPHKIVERGLVMVPEGRRIFTQMTVEENLEMGAYSQPNSGIKASLEEVYELFPRLKERRTQIGGTLSGGEQQMLAMGRALMAKPKLIMLDEPSMGLAPILVDHIFDIIKSLHQNGATILLVEQNAQAALSVADRASVLETGKVVMSLSKGGRSNGRTGISARGNTPRCARAFAIAPRRHAGSALATVFKNAIIQPRSSSAVFPFVEREFNRDWSFPVVLRARHALPPVSGCVLRPKTGPYSEVYGFYGTRYLKG